MIHLVEPQLAAQTAAEPLPENEHFVDAASAKAQHEWTAAKQAAARARTKRQAAAQVRLEAEAAVGAAAVEERRAMSKEAAAKAEVERLTASAK